MSDYSDDDFKLDISDDDDDFKLDISDDDVQVNPVPVAPPPAPAPVANNQLDIDAMLHQRTPPPAPSLPDELRRLLPQQDNELILPPSQPNDGVNDQLPQEKDEKNEKKAHWQPLVPNTTQQPSIDNLSTDSNSTFDDEYKDEIKDDQDEELGLRAPNDNDINDLNQLFGTLPQNLTLVELEQELFPLIDTYFRQERNTEFSDISNLYTQFQASSEPPYSIGGPGLNYEQLKNLFNQQKIRQKEILNNFKLANNPSNKIKQEQKAILESLQSHNLLSQNNNKKEKEYKEEKEFKDYKEEKKSKDDPNKPKKGGQSFPSL